MTSRVRYDETPLRIRASSGAPGIVDAARAVILPEASAGHGTREELVAAKIVQFEASGSVLVELEGAYHLIHFRLPTPLTLIDSGCVEVYKRLCLEIGPDCRQIEDRFQRSPTIGHDRR